MLVLHICECLFTAVHECAICWNMTYAVMEQLCLSTVTFISCLVSDRKISFMVTVEFWNYIWKSIFLNSVTLCSGILCLKWKLRNGKWSLFSPLWTGFCFFFFLFTGPFCSVVMTILNVLSFICRCCQCNQSGAETAQLLSKLEYEEIVSIISCKEFNSLNLKDCLKLGVQLTLQVNSL